MNLTSWQPFNRVPNADEIAAALKDIPGHWSLTPLQNKAPKRLDWQTEPFIPHELIASLIVKGEQSTSKRTGKPYRRYWSGFGLRTGDTSGGLLAIDVDGVSAQPILEAMSSGDIPTSVSWTSGKPGRYQLLFQVPADIRVNLQNFTRYVVTQWLGLETAKDESGKPSELLEFRYNRCQSVLPPSRHPETGSYQSINSPATSVALAPTWLCNLLLDFASEEQRHIAETSERVQRVKTQRQERKLTPISSNKGSLSDALDLSLNRLNPEDVFNWSGHNWRVQERYEWAGYCPRHNSKSGTAFRLNTNTLEWYCFGCDVGGHAVQYRHFVNGGNGTPKGKDFAEIVKGLAVEAGVSLQKANPREYVPIPGSGTKFRVQRRNLDELVKLFPALKTSSGQNWLKSREFTADVTVNSEYYYHEPPTEGKGHIVRSGLGTGKSYYANEYYIKEDDGAIGLGNRNSVLLQIQANARERHGLTWHHIQQDLKGSPEELMLIKDPQSKILMCGDSITYIQPDDATGKKFLIDEIESNLKHLHHSSTAVSYKRQICKERLTQIATNCASFLACDGNMTNMTADYMEAISGKKIKKIENLYTGNRASLTLYNGTVKREENKETGKWEEVERRLDEYSLLLQMMMEENERFIVAADSQEQLETWERQLQTKGKKTFRVDGTNSNTPERQKFIKDPAKYILENQIDVVLYSPSLDQGVSIDLKNYFKRGYFFFFGVVLTDTQIQFLGRVRDSNIELFVFCQTRNLNANKLNADSTPELLKEFSIEFMEECLHLSTEGETFADKVRELGEHLIQKSNDIHFDYDCKLRAKQHFEENNARNCFEYAARKAGWTVTVVTGHKVSTKERDETKAVIRLEKAERHLNANRLTDSEAEEKKRNPAATLKDKTEVAMHSLLKRLPGIETKTITEKKKILVPASETTSEKMSQNSECLETETPISTSLEVGHPLSGTTIDKQGEGVHDERVTVEVEIEVTRPVLDADFIEKVKFSDRKLIGRLEALFFLHHPDITKRRQQEKWYKALSLFVDEEALDEVKTVNPASYKSHLVRLKTLFKMGLGFFVSPDAAWTQETPEVLHFWEQGKDPKIAKKIGCEVGESDPCGYVGKVLGSFGLKRDSSERVVLASGKRARKYRLKPLDPTSQAIYDCIEARIMASIDEDAVVLDWEEIRKKAPHSTAGNPISTSLEVGHPLSGITIETQCKGVQIEPSDFRSVDQLAALQKSELEQLADALPLAETPEDFAGIIENSPREAVEEVIALQPNQSCRKQLDAWLKALNEPVDDSWVVAFLKDIAESDKFEALKELAKKPQMSLESLRRLSPKIQEKGGSFEPYQRLKLMLDALAGVKNNWVLNPYLQMV
ncbi:MAG TPA: plasmid replication protein, CyRepA1 family [Candidatus Sericytochromatia bacterium]